MSRRAAEDNGVSEREHGPRGLGLDGDDSVVPLGGTGSSGSGCSWCVIPTSPAQSGLTSTRNRPLHVLSNDGKLLASGGNTGG
jgi:hypothetical protein